MENTRAHIKATGMFHGMFFRSEVRRKARNLGLKGWVKKSDGGAIEIVAEGDKARIEGLVDDLKKGEFVKLIISVDVSWGDYTGEFKDFNIAYEDFV
ncbi:MAG: acylphosphatase [Candidatus Aenigmarchaeota archaeon]|nr:acylphosphatase [Candidatus Aenigmarchaeota archaeon]